jgi:hypothetical protein
LLENNLREISISQVLSLPGIGADITNMCRDAAMRTMMRWIAGLKPSEVKRSLGRE